MNAICGIFNTDNCIEPPEIGARMMDKLGVFTYDATATWYSEQIFLGCCSQHITPESKMETLPFFDICSELSITADAIIDNRNELCELLNIPKNESVTDSQIILKAYQRWEEACPKYFAGDFAFVIWNKKKNELFCARDHTGKQTLYYSYKNKQFIFSTLIKPILAVQNEGPALDEEWIADFLSINGVLHEVNSSKTIYKGIAQLPPAHTMTVNADGIKIASYWRPLELPELRLKSDHEYEEAFRDVFFKAVRCRLRSTGNIGVMLSGGLDSGSVASVAAIELERQGKRLKAFSAIPISSYRNWLPKTQIADESPYIGLYSEAFKNVDITYSRAESKNSLKDVLRFLTILEQPYKIVENLFWVDDLEQIAAQNGCKVILDGQFGNLTISYGDFMTNLYTLSKRHEWVSVLKEIMGFSRQYGINPWRAVKVMGSKILKRDLIAEYGRSAVPVNNALAEKWGSKERIKQAGFGADTGIRDLAEARRIITNGVFFSHLGPLDTKASLANRLARRDPTRDKRVIEFCMSIPGNQYVRNGQDRYLLRRAMAGILPEPVRTNYKVRGRQSADWIQRIIPEWKELKADIHNVLGDKNIEPFFNIDLLYETLNKLGDSLENETAGTDVRMLLICYIFYEFFKSLK